MNWEAVSAVAELFGLVAIVVSIVYLAAQIRTQVREFRLASIHEVSVNLMDSYTALQETGMADVWVRGTKDFDSLSETEKVQMFGFLQRNFRALEDAYYQAKDDRLDPRIWTGIMRFYGSMLAAPGVERAWELRKYAYSDDFQVFMDGIERTEYKLE